MLDFVKISLILFEVILSAVVLVRASNKDVLKGADDVLFVFIWPLFALLKVFAFLILFESNFIIITIVPCCLLNFIFIDLYSESNAGIKSTCYKIKL
jgi:hypothetical protein